MTVQPNLPGYQALAREHNVVPVYLELPADLETPLSVYLKLRAEGPSFLLESVEQGELVGRYSFVGTNPRWLLRCQGDEVQVYAPDGSSRTSPRGTRDAISCLQEAMSPYRAASAADLPAFWGGAVGFFGYDIVRQWEKIGVGPVDDLQLPDASFLFSRQSVLFDHVRQRMFLVLAVEVGPEDAYERACDELRGLRERLALPLSYQTPALPQMPGPDQFNRTREDYVAAVERAKEHIAAGDIFQIVLSQRLTRPSGVDAISLYRALRLKNPSPYMLLLDMGDFQLIGSSPEMLVRLEEGTATTRPIAGTRRRAARFQEDQALEKELLADPKERAEHIMLVDLGRNDLGRVCSYGSVHLPQFMEVERYSHVMHIVSTVEGRLRPDCQGYDLLRASFPAGTVSGAPKVRAMQLLDQLEPTRRGPYAGAVGTFSFGGDLNTCITIRTILKQGDRLHVQAGAGIVADSDPEMEYQETLAKLAAMRQAVELAEGDLFGARL